MPADGKRDLTWRLKNHSPLGCEAVLLGE